MELDEDHKDALIDAIVDIFGGEPDANDFVPAPLPGPVVSFPERLDSLADREYKEPVSHLQEIIRFSNGRKLSFNDCKVISQDELILKEVVFGRPYEARARCLAYAKRMIACDVFDYLIKTGDVTHFGGTLERAREFVDRYRKQLDRDLAIVPNALQDIQQFLQQTNTPVVPDKIEQLSLNPPSFRVTMEVLGITASAVRPKKADARRQAAQEVFWKLEATDEYQECLARAAERKEKRSKTAAVFRRRVALPRPATDKTSPSLSPGESQKSPVGQDSNSGTPDSADTKKEPDEQK